MSFKYAKLKGRIVEKFGTQGKFAEALGVVPMTVSRKLTGETTFTREDMVAWSTLLCIDREEIPNYFFE